MYSGTVQSIMNEVKKVVVGKDDIIEKVLTTQLAKGHILIEDIPGVGKTTLALAFSKAMELVHHRLQFTPDVLPTDVVGFTILNQNHEFEYKQGAIFCNLFLADEINRTSPKTQSALLEVMEEGKVTVDGITRKLPQPFTVIATQNPIGSVGTQMLPESQLDRFMIRITMGYPNMQNEIELLKNRQEENPIESVNRVAGQSDILSMQAAVKQVFVKDVIYEYIAELVAATRCNPLLQLGVSPRGTIAIMFMSKARAFVRGRGYVIPEDVRAVFSDVAGHRIILTSKSRIGKITEDQVLTDILKQVEAPVIAGMK